MTKEVHTSPLSLIFSSSLYGAYHLARRVLPLQREKGGQQYGKLEHTAL